MMVPIEKVFLRNQQLQQNPSHQRESPFYKKVRDSMKKRGMVNPLLVIEKEECNGQKYMCCIGNNRYLAALELGIKEVSFRKLDRRFFRGDGCDNCRQTGYRGRIGIHELLVMSEGVKNTILESSDSDTIKKQGLKENMITLRRDGVNKILHGLTTAEEILSITSE